jgi:hypothetical protein
VLFPSKKIRIRLFVIAHGVGQAARIFWPVRERAIA